MVLSEKIHGPGCSDEEKAADKGAIHDICQGAAGKCFSDTFSVPCTPVLRNHGCHCVRNAAGWNEGKIIDPVRSGKGGCRAHSEGIHCALDAQDPELYRCLLDGRDRTVLERSPEDGNIKDEPCFSEVQNRDMASDIQHT